MIGNNSQIFILSGNTSIHSQVNGCTLPGSSEAIRRRTKKNRKQPVIDVIVVLVALPSLMILALFLEASTRGNWLETSHSRFIVLGLGFALAAVCLAICMYVTSRLGGKLWTGAIPSDNLNPQFSYYNPRLNINEINDHPPSYDLCMGYDIPPPPYHAVVIDPIMGDANKFSESCSKYVAIQHI
ncbi:CLUMA_CG012593, isoform A [Clunio marinus]|uniref:CLUMA_CG012593, isoform A n=1 Tax=Clunio marinus TaxID=568069 RepID=A0A1J1II22_9DIPT|nr:CLUMA_CG012593, isoform A [Clunio marinus]